MKHCAFALVESEGRCCCSLVPHRGAKYLFCFPLLNFFSCFFLGHTYNLLCLTQQHMRGRRCERRRRTDSLLAGLGREEGRDWIDKKEGKRKEEGIRNSKEDRSSTWPYLFTKRASKQAKRYLVFVFIHFRRDSLVPLESIL